MNSAINPSSNYQAFKEISALFQRHGRLIYELAKREISERYSGQFFGLLWTIGHPLLLMLIYVFIFAYVFQTRVGGTMAMPLDYTSYILAGLIPWLAFQDSISKACTVIVSNTNVVKQVIFPLEVLPVKGVLATLFTEVVFLILLMIYTLINFGHLNWMYFLLPVLFMIQAAWMIGLAFFLSAVGPYFRDAKDFVQVFNTIGLFILPILYLPEAIPSAVRILLYLNPVSYLIWCFQDVLYFGAFRHPYAWIVLFFLGSISYVLGYRVFRKLKTMFGNVL
jgi:lipopolysaccharide transport system permease protein